VKKRNVFDEFRKHFGNGEGMSDLEVTLTAALHELVCIGGLYLCDPGDAQCPHCQKCERGSWQEDNVDVIHLINAAIEKFCRPAATERQGGA
jgi:hypothetical protein